jgi:hypothetical protein
MQEIKVPETPSIKREAALFDFFNELESDGSPRIAGFRYYKTDGTVGEKLHCSRSYESVTMAVQAPRSKKSREESDKHTTINLQANNLIRIVFPGSDGSRQVRHIKIKLITHYKPSFSKEWMEIRHPEKPVIAPVTARRTTLSGAGAVALEGRSGRSSKSRKSFNPAP